MLSNILPPVVHGDPARSRKLWFRLAALHTLGTVVSAAAVGGLLTAVALGINSVGMDSPQWASWVALVVVLLFLPRELGWTRFPRLLQSTRQVPREWANEYPRWMSSLLFGLGLGSGCCTRIIVPTYYLLLIWPFLTPGFLWPLLIWSGYGFARSLNVWCLAWTTPVDAPFPHAHSFVLALLDKTNWMYRVNAALMLVVATWIMAWGNLV